MPCEHPLQPLDVVARGSQRNRCRHGQSSIEQVHFEKRPSDTRERAAPPMLVPARMRASLLSALLAAVLAGGAVAPAAELTTGAILGSVRDDRGAPLAAARVEARAPSARYSATTDAAGDFVMLGVTPDTYQIVVDRAGFEPARETVTVLPGERERLVFSLKRRLHEIARVETRGETFAVGSTSDKFTVTAGAARATVPNESASGLATYLQGTVAGALSGVPGVGFDSFANAIVRGGKVQDTAFDYDSVPIPQGLIAEPGGNIAGAQLGTAGIGATTLTLSGYTDSSQNALGGVVNEIPEVGTYPAH